MPARSMVDFGNPFLLGAIAGIAVLALLLGSMSTVHVSPLNHQSSTISGLYHDHPSVRIHKSPDLNLSNLTGLAIAPLTLS